MQAFTSARQILGRQLALARQTRQLSADDAARLIGVSVRQVLALEDGHYDPVLTAEPPLLEAKLRIYSKKLGIPLPVVEELIADALKEATPLAGHLARPVGLQAAPGSRSTPKAGHSLGGMVGD